MILTPTVGGTLANAGVLASKPTHGAEHDPRVRLVAAVEQCAWYRHGRHYPGRHQRDLAVGDRLRARSVRRRP